MLILLAQPFTDEKEEKGFGDCENVDVGLAMCS